MARIFISYSRVDRAFTERFETRLSRMFPHVDIWYDDHLHGGDVWWEEILNQIALCDVFIYLLSNESVQSPYCQAEFTEARRLQKRVITVQIRDRTELTEELSDIQYVDMNAGVDDPDAWTRLGGAVNLQLLKAAKKRPLWQPRTPKPVLIKEAERPASASEVDTPALHSPAPPSVQTQKGVGLSEPWAVIIAAIITGIFGLLAAYIALNGNDSKKPNDDDKYRTQTAVALAGNLTPESPTPNPTKSNTPNPTATSTIKPTQTDTPEQTNTETPTLDIAEIVGTLDIQATAEQATLNVQTTAAARATEYAVGTQSLIDRTATATLWTFTPTPNMTASIDAYRAQQAATITQAWMDSWTDTPTPSDTPTLTLTPTLSPTSTATMTPTPSPTPDPQQATLERARTFSGGNKDWEEFVREFDGVEMVLVPAGCFEMGSTEERQEAAFQQCETEMDTGNCDRGWYYDEGPAHRVCFDEPFWIDRTEVTNTQFEAFNGQAANASYFSGDKQPREKITWTEAAAFCARRGARLPTEAEWEYAARGPESWEYPWGDTFVSANFVWYENSSNQTADVGSKPAGASWVGALDMSGNVWEWAADWYDENYYSTLVDGVVNPTGPASGKYRAERGGSWMTSSSGSFRAADRSWNYPDLRNPNSNMGFRCARSG